MSDTRTRFAAVAALLFVIGVGCRSEKQQTGTTPPAASAMHEVDRVALMEKHYFAAIAAHDALIRGDEAGVRSNLGALSGQSLPPHAPAAWKPLHATLIRAAATAPRVTTLEAAEASMGQVVEACGGCHAKLASGPVYQKPGPYEASDRLKAEMRKHQWASERLWEGVTGPWDDAWKRGAAALATMHVFKGREAGSTEELRRDEAALRAMGERATRTTSLHGRAELYGELLGSCAGCHRAAGVILKPAAGNRSSGL